MKIYKKKVPLLVKRHKIFFLYVAFWFYIMYLNDRDFTVINIILNIIVAFIFYLIFDGILRSRKE